MKYFVSYMYGESMMGDLNGGCEEFDTEAEAIARADEIMQEHGISDPTITIIKGVEIEYRFKQEGGAA